MISLIFPGSLILQSLRDGKLLTNRMMICLVSGSLPPGDQLKIDIENPKGRPGRSGEEEIKGVQNLLAFLRCVLMLNIRSS